MKQTVTTYAFLSKTTLVLSLLFAFFSCSTKEEIEQTEQPLPEPQPVDKPVAYDSVYNSNYHLYVIENDTTYYSPDNVHSDFNQTDMLIGKKITEYAVKMLLDYDVQESSNTVLSPLSATTLYAMMSNFINTSETGNNYYKDEIDVNGVSTGDLNSYYQKLMDKESSDANNNAEDCFSVENNLWMREGQTVYQSFLSTSRAYGVKVKGINMDNPTDVSEVNNAIRNHTGEQEMGINNASIRKNGTVVSSSLAFKKEWKDAFHVDGTSFKFKPAYGDSISCKMLYAVRKSRYGQFNSFDIIRI